MSKRAREEAKRLEELQLAMELGDKKGAKKKEVGKPKKDDAEEEEEQDVMPVFDKNAV